MAQDRTEEMRRALCEFLDKDDVSMFNDFLPGLAAGYYYSIDALSAATVEGLKECGAPRGLIDMIISRKQGEEVR